MVEKPLRHARSLVAFFAVFASCVNVGVSEESPVGKNLFAQHCAKCHGGAGQGGAEYESPLVGDLAVDDLAKYIDQSMPESDPKLVQGEDAKAVAQFMFDAFYSPIAQARNQPARVELARLTVAQYRQSVADLVATFRRDSGGADKQGLETEFFNSDRNIRRDRKVHEQVDEAISFELSDESAPPKLNRKEFNIRWSGGLWAETTGRYEFIIKTDNGARLWINDDDTALIDAWVKSGKQNEFVASIYLIAGRVYPLKLEYFKSKKEDASNISLWWKQPHRSGTLIPPRNFFQGRFTETYVCQSPFPPDDRSRGYERGSSVSKEWNEATTRGALETMTYVNAHLSELSRSRKTDNDREQKVRDFCTRFVERAFRRPLTEEGKKLFVDRQFAEGVAVEESTKRVVLLTLKSPRFLYRNVQGVADPYTTAAHISFGLWDSLPDTELLQAAAQGKLQDRESIAAQVRRMLPDLRTKAKVRKFFLAWLNVDEEKSIIKDDERFADFSDAFVSDLRTSLDLQLEGIFWSEPSDYRQIFQGDAFIANPTLARFYGAEPADESGFQSVELKSQNRAGVLTHPLLMADFAYTSESSPIHRGVFVARHLLGRTLNPPPDSFTPISPDLHPDLTTRERTQQQTAAETCQHCHAMINSLGFSLEHFDAAGRYQTVDRNKPIDTSGGYHPPGKEAVKFAGASDLAKYLAESTDAQKAFVDEMFHFTMKQPIRAYGDDTTKQIHDKFANKQFNMQELLVEIVATAAQHKTTLQGAYTPRSPLR